MIRFFTRLFATRTPAATRPARRVSLSVESLETRETPSGMGVSKILKEISHVLKESAALQLSHLHANVPSHMPQNGVQLGHLPPSLVNLLTR